MTKWQNYKGSRSLDHLDFQRNIYAFQKFYSRFQLIESSILLATWTTLIISAQIKCTNGFPKQFSWIVSLVNTIKKADYTPKILVLFEKILMVQIWDINSIPGRLLFSAIWTLSTAIQRPVMDSLKSREEKHHRTGSIKLH